MGGQLVTLTLFDHTGRRKYLNQGEREKFLNALNNQGLETRLFFLLLFWTGARISEGHNTNVSNIDFEEGIVVIKSLKKRNKTVFRTIPLPPEYCLLLKAYIEENHLQSRIWSKSVRSYSRYIKIVMRDACIEGPQASSKGLRHGFAVHCVIRRVPVTLIQSWLGHSNLNITMIYVQLLGPEAMEFAQRIWEEP